MSSVMSLLLFTASLETVSHVSFRFIELSQVCRRYSAIQRESRSALEVAWKRMTGALNLSTEWMGDLCL